MEKPDGHYTITLALQLQQYVDSMGRCGLFLFTARTKYLWYQLIASDTMKISFIKMCRQFLKVGSGGEGYNEWWLDVENVSMTSNNATTYNAWSFNPPKVEHNF